MADFPERDQQAPNYWDVMLKDYIDEGDENAVGSIEGMIEDAVALAVEQQESGIELGYAERLTAFVSETNALIPGLTVEVTGQGRPVEIEFYCSAVGHSEVGTWVQAVLIEGIGNQIAGSGEITGHATFGRFVVAKRRMILTEDQEYTFSVNTTMLAAGTSTWSATPTRPMYLSVVSR